VHFGNKIKFQFFSGLLYGFAVLSTKNRTRYTVISSHLIYQLSYGTVKTGTDAIGAVSKVIVPGHPAGDASLGRKTRTFFFPLHPSGMHP
jgi:hypothetical protein